MSIEQALAAQTAAVKENTAALAALTAAWNSLREQAIQMKASGKTVAAAHGVPLSEMPAVETPAPATKAEPKPKAAVKDESAPKAEPQVEATPADTQPASETAPTVTAESTAAPESPSEATPASTSIDIKQLTAIVTAAATRNRDGLLAVLAKYGVKRASELNPDQWPALAGELEAV